MPVVLFSNFFCRRASTFRPFDKVNISRTSTTSKRTPIHPVSATKNFNIASPTTPANTNSTIPQESFEADANSSASALSNKKSKVLGSVLQTMTEQELRNYLSDLCKTIPSVKEKLERDFFTQGKRIVRYREQDEDYSDFDSNFEEMESDPEGGVRARPISIGDEDYIARWARCVRCGEGYQRTKFDLTKNRSKDCHWHPGNLTPGVFDDNGNMFFSWDCCYGSLDDECCKHTRHKSEMNVVQRRPSTSSGSKKRKAGDLE